MADAQQPAAPGFRRLRVVVTVCVAPREVREHVLELPAGATAQDALQACGVPLPPVEDAGALGVWGRRAAPEALLKDGDRVEVYRPLVVDPKVARRERFARQGARTAGLFARQRPGAKAGY